MIKSVIGINTSARKNWNTGKLVAEALRGAESKGAKTELIHLAGLQLTGCNSCLYCKSKNAIKGKCTIQDDLTPILKKIENCDALIIGTPIYFATESARYRVLMERFFPWFEYTSKLTNFPKKIKSGVIFTMNIDEQLAKQLNYDITFQRAIITPSCIFGIKSEILPSYNTLQVKDYFKYNIDRFDPKEKYESRKINFPKDLERAFKLGQKLVE